MGLALDEVDEGVWETTFIIQDPKTAVSILEYFLDAYEYEEVEMNKEDDGIYVSAVIYEDDFVDPEEDNTSYEHNEEKSVTLEDLLGDVLKDVDYECYEDISLPEDEEVEEMIRECDGCCENCDCDEDFYDDYDEDDDYYDEYEENESLYPETLDAIYVLYVMNPHIEEGVDVADPYVGSDYKIALGRSYDEVEEKYANDIAKLNAAGYRTVILPPSEEELASMMIKGVKFIPKVEKIMESKDAMYEVTRYLMSGADIPEELIKKVSEGAKALKEIDPGDNYNALNN